MDEAQAAEEARRRNDELGARGERDAFWMEVRQSDGTWSVEKEQGERPGPLKRLWRAFIDSPGGP